MGWRYRNNWNDSEREQGKLNIAKDKMAKKRKKRTNQ
jgi:hypothetical protein